MATPTPPEAGATVVVVNDDATQRTVLSGLLRRAGLEPRAFESAEAALAAMVAAAGPPDGDPGSLPVLVVTDLYMPGIDGWRFCRLLRSPEYAAFNEVPILVVSATFAGDEADRIAADLGANAFLSSPVDGERFGETVRTLLRGGVPRHRPRVLVVEDGTTRSGDLAQAFEAHGYEADTVQTARAADAAFASVAYDVAVLDHHLPDGTGDALLEAFRARRPDCVCVLTTSDLRPELALEVMKRGAAACLRRPFEAAYLIELCERARREHALLRVQDLLELRTRELQASEARFRNAMDATRDGLWDWDVPAGRTYYSPAYMGMLGYSPDELPFVPGTWIDLVHPEDRPHALAANEACLQNETQGVDVEFRMRARDGSWRWIRGRGRAVRRDAQGQALQMIGTHEDVTERKQAEEALRLSEDKFAKAFHSSPDAVLITRASDGRVAEVNEGFTRLTGYERDEALRSSSFALNLWVDAGARERYVSRLESDGSVRDMPGDFRVKSGAILQCLFAGALIDVGGEPHILSVVRDITKQRRVEDALRQSEEQLASALEGSGVGLWDWHVQTGEAVFNERWAEIVGYTLAELSPVSVETWTSLCHPDDLQRSDELLEEHFSGRLSIYECEARIRHKDGRWVWVLDRGKVSQWDTDGRPLRMAGTHLDITERKQAEAEIRALNEELEQRVVERTAKLAASNRELETFSYSVSHDLKAPLRAISGFGALLARRYRDNLDEKGRHYVDTIVESSEHMGILIEELLDYSRLGRTMVRAEPVPLGPLVTRIRATLGERIAAAGATLEVVEPLAVPTGDPTLIERILANLVDNALTYRPPDVAPHVTLSATRRGPSVVLAVADNGIGIPAEYREKIFEVFTRLHSDEAYPGTGIGLAIIRKAARLMGSEISVDSTEGEGSTFSLELPAADEPGSTRA